MARQPFQVLVLPYIVFDGAVMFALFRRTESGGGYWQGIAGGGEQGETPLKAARREAFEEAGIGGDANIVTLHSMVTIPVVAINGFQWGDRVLVIPEYAFGVQAFDAALRLSAEHDQYAWCDIDEAMARARWDSNRNALWELHHRLCNGLLG